MSVASSVDAVDCLAPDRQLGRRLHDRDFDRASSQELVQTLESADLPMRPPQLAFDGSPQDAHMKIVQRR
jgi:hypothetical protein